jgi:hypothetical protein
VSVIKFEVVYNTETCQYTVDTVSEGYSLVHSGSSYFRILKDGAQIGTVGGTCPGTQYLVDKLASCADFRGDYYQHVSFSIKKEFA